MRKNKIYLMIILILWTFLSLYAWFSPAKEISEVERRKLQQFPEITLDAVLSGDWTEDFESYTLDQFPLRNRFRKMKGIFHSYVLNQKDNNDIYIHNGSAIKMEYPLNEHWLNNAIEKFDKIYNKYLKDTDATIYMSVIPDKNYYAAKDSNHLSMDYVQLFQSVKNIKWAKYIDITKDLSLESYYNTDPHWRQESILKAAETLCNALKIDFANEDEYSTVSIGKPFYGDLYGQSGLFMKPDTMYLMENEYINAAMVFDYETSETIRIYEDSTLENRDMYDIYLSGAKALLRIDNPIATSEKELIVFRDSFGSSIIPLMLKGYETITVIDIRYIASDFIGDYVKFDNQDILFLYSTTVLNNSETFK